MAPIVQLKEQDGNPSGLTPPSGEAAIWGDSESNYGVYGSAGGNTGVGVFGQNNIDGGEGVHGDSVNGFGVHGTSGFGIGVFGKSTNGAGVSGESTNGNGVVGESTQSTNGNGVVGISVNGFGVFGFSTNIAGVYGDSTSGIGVHGKSTNEPGVYGESANGIGVVGYSTSSAFGVHGINFNSRGYAGYFHGNVHVAGTLSKTMGGFRIDHPLDPANKYLSHSFVESPDMKNLYDGVAVLDAQGEFIVELPLWFEALNQDFRYQLTPIGAAGPNLYIAEEIRDRRFKIAGGPAGMKVCWQVTGNRKDAYAQANPLVVEQEKAATERGRYLHPEVYGHSQEQSIAWPHHPEALRRSLEEQQKTRED